MQTQKIIEKLGFSTKEAKVYLAALVLGECHVSDIAEKVKMPRTSTQIIVDKLHKEGLMSFYVMRRYKYWVAENPERILTTLKNREEMIKEAIPRLILLKNDNNRNSKFFRDMTQSLALFHIFANTSLLPIMITNELIEIEYVNPAWEKIFGYSSDEVIGENPNILKSAKADDSLYEKMWDTVKSGRLFQAEDFIEKKRDGTLFKIKLTVFPVHHNGILFYVQVLDEIVE